MTKYDINALPIPVLYGHDDWIELYNAAWEMAFGNVEHIEKDGWKPQLTCMPGAGITWQWDSCFMTFITNYSNGTVSALNNLDNLYRLQRDDGFMAMAYRTDTEEEAYPGRINPPLMAWAEWTHYRISGDGSRLRTVLPALERFYDYIEKNRRRDNGLYWFEDSGSSGMDNSPRGGYVAAHLDGSDVSHADLACQQALSAKCISLICGAIGNEEKQKHYSSEYERIKDLVNRYHRSDRSGWYFDVFHHYAKDKYLNSKSAAAFWALTSCCADSGMIAKMTEHIFNENEFYTTVPFATLSKDDPNYDGTGGYWLGGVWAPTNYAAVCGLRENGCRELAHKAAVRYLDAMCKVYNNPDYGSIWEAYSPDSFRPSTTETGDTVRKNFVGWSGLGPVTMLIENIIGLDINGADNTVTFDLFPDTPGGLRNMRFRDGYLSVVCAKYDCKTGRSVIETECDNPFTLIVRTIHDGTETTMQIPAGKHVFRL